MLIFSLCNVSKHDSVQIVFSIELTFGEYVTGLSQEHFRKNRPKTFSLVYLKLLSLPTFIISIHHHVSPERALFFSQQQNISFYFAREKKILGNKIAKTYFVAEKKS